MSTDDLAPLLNPEKGSVVRYGSGKVVSWDADGFANRILFHGSEIEDFSVYGGINALTIQQHDEVAMLGYESPGGISTWWVLGRIIPPGEDASTMVVRGGSIVMEGGAFQLVDKNGDSVVYFGDVTQGDTVSRGFIFRFDGGALAFEMGGAPGSQFWGLRDRTGNILVSNDALTGAGLARPYIPLPIPQPVNPSDWQNTTDTSFAVISRSQVNVQHPRIRANIRAFAPSGTNGQVRLMMGGTQVGPTLSGGDGSFFSDGFDAEIPAGVGFDSTATVELEARVTSGPDDVAAIVRELYGIQS